MKEQGLIRLTYRKMIFLVVLIFALGLLGLYASMPKIQCYDRNEVFEICIFRPWHSMILESDPVMVSAIVDEDVETVKQLASNFNVTSSSDANKKVEPWEHFPMIVRERAGGGITTYFGYLEQGRWLIDITIENQTSLEVLHRGGTTIFVQPVQDYYNAVIAIGTIIVGVTSPIIAFAGLRSQRKQATATLTEMQKQRQATIDEMKEDRQISEASLNVARETMRQQLRPWIGRAEIVLVGAIMENGEYVSLRQEPGLQQKGMPVTKFVLIFWLQNYGKLPAVNCSTGTQVGKSSDMQAKLQKEDVETIPLQGDFAISPGEKIPINIEIREDIFKKDLNVMGRAKYRHYGGEGYYDFIMEFDGLSWTMKYNRMQ